MEIGNPGHPLREIPVNLGNVGMIIIGGLNPVAILEECGIRVQSKALSGLVDYRRLFPYEEMENRLEAMELPYHRRAFPHRGQ
jgi:repressor of nif and glnA expression